MQVHVYVCPTPGCGNYYGSSSQGDLSEKIVGQMGQNFERRPESQWHSRAQCPDCRARGNRVERLLLTFEQRPAADPPAEAMTGALTPPELPQGDPPCPHMRQTRDSATDIWQCDDCGAINEGSSLVSTLTVAPIPPEKQWGKA